MGRGNARKREAIRLLVVAHEASHKARQGEELRFLSAEKRTEERRALADAVKGHPRDKGKGYKAGKSPAWVAYDSPVDGHSLKQFNPAPLPHYCTGRAGAARTDDGWRTYGTRKGVRSGS